MLYDHITMLYDHIIILYGHTTQYDMIILQFYKTMSHDDTIISHCDMVL